MHLKATAIRTWGRSIVIISLALLHLTSSAPSSSSSSSSSSNCSFVLAAVEGLGVPAKGSPPGLRICNSEGSGGGCCTAAIESRLLEASHQFMERQTREALGKYATVLSKRAQKFNEYFKELLVDSKKEFHAMFKRTYGAIYEQNSYVFSDLFVELETYYTWGQVNLSKVLDEFFNKLYQKMFTVLNSQFSYDDKYLFCVSEHMNELKPFGDVPDKLSVQIKRSFVATRTYAQVLATGAEVLKKAMNMKPSLECAMAVTRMRNCSLCSTGTLQRPCPNFCADTMHVCMKDFVELDTEWNNFVEGIEKVSERLLGPFNVVMVVEPINIKISEAIMNFQERNKEISGQVFQGCGRPLLGRRRRDVEAVKQDDDFLFLDGDAPVEEVGEAAMTTTIERRRVGRSADPEPNKEIRDFEPVRFSNENYAKNDQGGSGNGRNGSGGGGGGGGGRGSKSRGRGSKSRMDYDVNMEPTLDKLIKDIKQRVRETKKMWSNLPLQICNHAEFNLAPLATTPLPSATNNLPKCWNGKAVVSWDATSAAAGHRVGEAVSKAGLPSVTSPLRSKIVEAQLSSLRTAVGQLRNAYNGQDVEWNDEEENDFGSGAGSGGSNYDDEDDTEGGDDREENGSGMGEYDPSFGTPSTTTHQEPHPTAGGDVGHTGGVPVEHDKKNREDDDAANGVSPSSSTGRPVHPKEEEQEEDRTVNVLGGGVDGDERVVPQEPKSGTGPGTDSTSGSPGGQPEMSITRAVVTYFFPIFMAWFGGIFSVLL